MTLAKKTWVSGILLLGLILVLIIFCIQPLFSEIKKISQSFISQKERIITLEQKTQSLENFTKIFPTLSPELEKIDKLFVDQKLPIDFITFLEQTAKNCQLSLEIVSSSPVSNDKDPWPSLSFQLNLAGSFPNISRFLEKLESAPYLIEIQNLTIFPFGHNVKTITKFEQPSDNLESNVSIKVYAR